MRVIAGTHRGRPLKSLEGSTTRPTTDRVKEALMSTLYSALPQGFEGITVLDAFAGSGALGIEALSRGAQRCMFCDMSAAARKIVMQNLKNLGLDEVSRVVSANVLSGTQPHFPTHKPYDLVFLDPPYATDPKEVATFISLLDKAGELSPDCLLSYECAKNDAQRVESVFDALKWQTVSDKHYGNTAVVVLKRMQ